MGFYSLTDHLIFAPQKHLQPARQRFVAGHQAKFKRQPENFT
ncbi:MAG: hypothetical protein Q8L26_03840 [Candidatus Omnitrophota bacterium]|nr:hypothetical protein [Candidatus Omnitrophota bacterium]